MNDETNQLLRRVSNRLEEMQAETKANFDQVNQQFNQVNQRLDRVEQTSVQTNQKLDALEQRVAQLFERVKKLEEQFIAIGFEIKEDIAVLSGKIERLQIDVYAGRSDAARAIVAVKDLEKRVAAFESERRAA